MTVRLVPAREREPPVDRVLWRSVKAQRSAVAVARLIPRAGLELRISVDSELRWTRAYGWDTRALDAEAESKRRALIECGWTIEAETT